MMRSKVLTFTVLIFMLIVSACAPAATQAAPTATLVPEATNAPAPTNTALPEPTEAPPTPQPVTLTVLAAASLTESFTELGAMFEEANPGVTLSFNFAGSQALAEQLAQGAPADVFASASGKYMTAAVESGRVADGAQTTFVTNRLVVIFPIDNPAEIAQLQDLIKDGVSIDLADQAVPVGQYSLDFLDKASADAAFGASFKDDVLANVVSYEDNVKAVLTKVSLGEVDAGIVYISDITVDAADKVGTLDIPDELNTIANYPIAAIADSEYAELAQAFVDFVLSPEGQAVMAKYNFVPAVK
jgi:molybdate transport system substrate-binding protein